MLIGEITEKIKLQFNSRIIPKLRSFGSGSKAMLSTEVLDNLLWIKVADHQGNIQAVTVPVPFEENGVLLIERDDTRRAVCPFYSKKDERVLSYLDVIDAIILGDPTGIIPDYLLKGVNFMMQLTNAIHWGTLNITIRNLQRAINEVVNRMPLHKTYMNSWAMNRRLMIIDLEFDLLTSPKERHNYQILKNRTYFGRGWTSIGLSDGSLSDKNYILTEDLRKYVPFGLKYHNPQRNLYSTLGMEGDEYPLVRSESMQRLFCQGISRKGWNLFTVFVDIPDVWEDQLMVDTSLLDKFVEHSKRYQVFGTVLVNKGDKLKKGQRLSVAADGEATLFKLTADKAWVDSIHPVKVSVGGIPTEAFNIVVKYRRNFKDGMKITNMAANKGVMRVKDLGYAVDPRTGEKRKIDVIVSCRAIEKRKNYTQILEALINNIFGEELSIFPDDIEVTQERLEERLVEAGFPKEGTWQCYTYAGNFEAIAGKVFWGITKDVEDQLWEDGETTAKNGRGLRDAGLKFSTVELRALETRFGKDNPVLSEILTYAQGTEDINEMLKVLKVKRGEYPADAKVIELKNVKPADTTTASIVPKSAIIGSVLDENFFPEGFLLKLPEKYMICSTADGELVFEGFPGACPEGATAVIIDRLYIPSSNLRKCWRHSTGKLGLSEFGAFVNNIVELGHKVVEDPNNGNYLSLFYRIVTTYFDRVATIMGTKRGELSVNGMSVRYPYSAKAVATLSNSLPKNTIEIHSAMARQLEVSNGDVVLVERFPCLGFTCIRPQKVKVTDDAMCRFTIRASGNSLGSTGLDFDGDVLYIAAMHSKEAKKCLAREWTNPNKSCYDFIQELNEKMGAPHTNEMTLADYAINKFPALTVDTHADIVDKLTGVKSNTGPVIALAYNIMRIIENSRVKDSQKTNCAIEVFLDKVANSIFKQKHGVKALSDIVVDAICVGDVETLVTEGFKRSTSQIICDIIEGKAAEIGVLDLKAHHDKAKATGGSNIINKIVRNQNKIYFASRSVMEGLNLLKHLEAPVVDVPSKLLAWVMSGKSSHIVTELEKRKDENCLNKFSTTNMKEASKTLCALVDKLFGGINTTPSAEELEVPQEDIDSMRRSISVVVSSVLKGCINKNKGVFYGG